MLEILTTNIRTQNMQISVVKLQSLYKTEQLLITVVVEQRQNMKDYVLFRAKFGETG